VCYIEISDESSSAGGSVTRRDKKHTLGLHIRLGVRVVS